jgi:hypothetical protein
MSYTIDVYRGTQRAERDFVLVAYPARGEARAEVARRASLTPLQW